MARGMQGAVTCMMRRNLARAARVCWARMWDLENSLQAATENTIQPKMTVRQSTSRMPEQKKGGTFPDSQVSALKLDTSP